MGGERLRKAIDAGEEPLIVKTGGRFLQNGDDFHPDTIAVHEGASSADRRRSLAGWLDTLSELIAQTTLSEEPYLACSARKNATENA